MQQEMFLQSLVSALENGSASEQLGGQEVKLGLIFMLSGMSCKEETGVLLENPQFNAV